MAKRAPRDDLVRHLERRPEPARAGFLKWLEGLAAFGHEAPVRAALALARSKVLAVEDELMNDGSPPLADERPAAALAAVEAWLAQPTEANRRACEAAAAAGRCADEDVFRARPGAPSATAPATPSRCGSRARTACAWTTPAG